MGPLQPSKFHVQKVAAGTLPLWDHASRRFAKLFKGRVLSRSLKVYAAGALRIPIHFVARTLASVLLRPAVWHSSVPPQDVKGIFYF